MSCEVLPGGQRLAPLDPTLQLALAGRLGVGLSGMHQDTMYLANEIHRSHKPEDAEGCAERALSSPMPTSRR